MNPVRTIIREVNGLLHEMARIREYTAEAERLFYELRRRQNGSRAVEHDREDRAEQ